MGWRGATSDRAVCGPELLVREAVTLTILIAATCWKHLLLPALSDVAIHWSNHTVSFLLSRNLVLTPLARHPSNDILSTPSGRSRLRHADGAAEEAEMRCKKTIWN